MQKVCVYLFQLSKQLTNLCNQFLLCNYQLLIAALGENFICKCIYITAIIAQESAFVRHLVASLTEFRPFFQHTRCLQILNYFFYFFFTGRNISLLIVATWCQFMFNDYEINTFAQTSRNVIKLFTAVIYINVPNKLVCLSLASLLT
jgi:hypothetical protein